MSVSVNPPKTPVTEGSSGVAAATLPNVCKMPGPPAPFVPAPLPNIGKSDNSPKGYSTSVTIAGKAIAIQGATFNSMGDVASQGTGGGLVSNNVQGPTSFVGPGSMDVKIDGKNVQLLGDQMTNNGGPSGTPANAATMPGEIQEPGLMAMTDEGLKDLANACNESVNEKRAQKAPPSGKECTALGTKKHKCCEKAIKKYKEENPSQDIASEVPFDRTFKEIPASQESAARSAANAAYSAAKAAGQVTKGVWASSYFGNGGAAFKADVIMSDEDGVKKAFDFKFNCKKKGQMTKKQRANYKNAGLGNVTMLHVPGYP